MTHEDRPPTVVVGTDGSEQARLAVKWASDEARRREATLVVVHARVGEPEHVPAWFGSDTTGVTAGEAIVDDAVALAATRHPALAVHGRVADWPASMVLTGESRTADLLVVGARGRGGFAGLLLGSVGDQCTQYAHCPVAVVRSEPDDPTYQVAQPRIVVGIDGSPGSSRALRWALDEAAIRSAGVEAVFAWHYPSIRAALAGSLAAYEEEAGRIVDAAAAAASEWAPDVRFEATARSGPTVQTLLDASRGSGLLVLGAHGHGGFVDALLGSVAHQCAHHAPCSVVVVRPTLDEAKPAAGDGAP
ncbi:MAG: universal stress protein [Acidimicrobiales bacterium]